MIARIVVTGTDTDIGKTVFAAALADALGAAYWKPVQAGLEDGGDGARIATLTDLPPAHILPERHRLATACSPHLAARIDGVSIDAQTLEPPPWDGTMIIEGAGGLLVPLGDTTVYADVFQRWGFPVVLVARTALGTINHSLLSIEALRARGVPILGIAFVGDAVEDSEATIARMGKVRRLGRLPMLPTLDRATLAAAFAAHFSIEDFR